MAYENTGTVRIMNNYKLVMFDMDGTLLNGRGIFKIAEKKGFLDKLLAYIKDKNYEFYERSIKIAKLSEGYHTKEYFDIFQKIPLQENVIEVIEELKKKNIKTAIVTDSYQFLAENLRERLGMDYAYANNLIINDNIITGELEIHNKDLIKDEVSGGIYSICKGYVLEELCKKHNISNKEVIAIGDGIVDIGMIRKAGLGIAFNAPEHVGKHADVISNKISTILDYVDGV